MKSGLEFTKVFCDFQQELTKLQSNLKFFTQTVSAKWLIGVHKFNNHKINIYLLVENGIEIICVFKFPAKSHRCE